MNKFKKIRIDKGLTLQEMSKLTKISVGTLANIERNKTSASVLTISKFVKTFDLPIDYFL